MKFIERTITSKLVDMVKKFPVVYLTGPRQSGKTTLLKLLFHKCFEYVNLEEKDSLDFALSDPRGFLNAYKGRLIIDEAQRAPELLSYIQAKLDHRDIPGMYILIGTRDFTMMKNISRSLAGRVGILILPPLSLEELGKAGRLPKSAGEWIFNGAYPRLVSAKIEPEDFFSSYIAACIEKDIRFDFIIRQFDKFRRFLGAVAASTGKPVNLSTLGEEASVDARTANSWLSILEGNFILFRLPAYYSNLGKRYVKSPKIYFYDTGLLCALLGFTRQEELSLHPMRGHIFESAVISESAKKYFSSGRRPALYYWQESANSEKEIKLLEGSPRGLELNDIKLSQTANKDYAKYLLKFKPPTRTEIKTRRVIYDGSDKPVFSGVRYANWKSLFGEQACGISTDAS